MWLEDFTPSESWPEAWAKSSEVSEKFKEAVKKASAWIKRVQKDEKKAQKFDSLLASFLVQIIRDKRYDFLLDSLFKALDNWYSSNFLLWILSLIYLPISDKIRELSKKPKIIFKPKIHFIKTDFDDSTIDENLKNRINLWIEDIIDIISLEYSFVQTQRMLELFKNKDESIVEFTWLVFSFFFSQMNINISNSKSQSYSKFILSEIKLKIEKLELEEV